MDKPPFVLDRFSAKGIEPDLLREIFAKLNYQVTFVQKSKNYLENALFETNDIDVVATVSQKDKRIFNSHIQWI